MTVSSTTNRNNYVGDGANSSYSYTFKIFSNTDLTVFVRDTNDVETQLTLTTDYTVTGVGEEAGGTIVLVDSGQSWLDGDGDLLTSYIISIRRVRPLTQLTDIRNQGSFLPETHEDEFDKGRMVDQQQQDELDRSVKLPESIDPSAFSGDLPGTIASAPAGSGLVVNSTQDGFDFAVAGLTDLTILAGTGLLSSNGTTGTPRTITGTSNEVDVSNGNGDAGNPTIGLSDNAVLPGTEGVVPPTGTTAQRPGTPTNGELRYNSTLSALEAYDGGAWKQFRAKVLASITASDTPYTALITDESIRINAISDDITVTLPAASSLPGKTYSFKRTDVHTQVTDTFVDGDVTVGTDNINVASHPFTDLQKVQLTTTGTLPAGLSTSTDYWVIFVDANNIELASSLANAIADTAVDITAAAGGGTHTITSESNSVTIDPNSTETIDGSTTYSIFAQNDSVSIVSDGTNWIIEDQKRKRIVASYSASASSANIAFADNTAERVDFDTEDIDSHDAVTTGASWVFTAPRDGNYKVFATTGWANSTNLNSSFMAVHRNGTIYKRLDFKGTTLLVLKGGVVVPLTASDTVSIFLTQDDSASAARNISTDTLHNHISVYEVEET